MLPPIRPPAVGDAEGDQAEEDDLLRVSAFRKLEATMVAPTEGGKEDRDDVHQGILHGVGQTVRHTALAEEVAEHQAADQRSRGRQKQDDKDGDDDPGRGSSRSGRPGGTAPS